MDDSSFVWTWNTGSFCRKKRKKDSDDESFKGDKSDDNEDEDDEAGDSAVDSDNESNASEDESDEEGGKKKKKGKKGKGKKEKGKGKKRRRIKKMNSSDEEAPVVNTFLSHKINFVTLCFRPFYQKKKIFFLRNQEIFSFLCVLDPGDHFTKSRPASGVLRTKL